MGQLTSEQLRIQFRPRLREELDVLRLASGATAEHRKPVELDQQSVGRLSRMDAIQQQAMANAVDGRRNGRIRAVEAALQRLEGHDFGWCDACGEFIGEKRLELDPTIMRCRECAK